ncbi:hypothetical protein CPB85DRAFT_608188 [Mucidula mucida]|nr:hypothetical protein CPB85DRAFT_608188 [Mucidula mucida]
MTARQAPDMRSNAPPTVPASVKHLLASNELPSDAEISLLRGLCASFSAELTRLDDKSASLLSSSGSQKNCAFAQLEDDRVVLQNRLRQVLSALSTIRGFPQEILQEIFLNLIPDGGFMVLDPTQGAWAASCVCSSWRSASRYPQLWTTFRITYGGCGYIEGGSCIHRRPTFIRSKNPVAILQTALRYSGSYKLDWHLEIQYNDCVENRSRIHSLLDALMFHSRRWARISLAVPCELGTYLGAVQGKVPELRHLTFMGCDPKFLWKAWRKNNAPHMISAFAVAPKLTQVSVENALLQLNYVLLTSFTSKSSVYFLRAIPPLFVIRRLCGSCLYGGQSHWTYGRLPY